MSLIVPDRNFEAPELFIPGRQPGSPSFLDVAHELAPDELCVVFNGPVPIDLVTERCLDVGAQAPYITSDLNGQDIVKHFDGAVQAYYDTPSTISHGSSTEWSLTWFGATDGVGGSNDGVFIGVAGTTVNYVWMKGGGIISVNVAGQEAEDVDIPWDEPAWNTLLFDAPGYRYFRDGVLWATNTACSAALSINCIGASYSSASYAFAGILGAVYIHGQNIGSDGVRRLHDDPYQFLILR